MAKGIPQTFRLRPEIDRLVKLARINITEVSREAVIREVERRLGISVDRSLNEPKREYQRAGRRIG